MTHQSVAPPLPLGRRRGAPGTGKAAIRLLLGYADEDDREATAHKVAWSAVKGSYEKRDGRWVEQ